MGYLNLEKCIFVSRKWCFFFKCTTAAGICGKMGVKVCSIIYSYLPVAWQCPLSIDFRRFALHASNQPRTRPIVGQHNRITINFPTNAKGKHAAPLPFSPTPMRLHAKNCSRTPPSRVGLWNQGNRGDLTIGHRCATSGTATV